MKLARDHAKKLSRLADDHAKALERRDQEHRAERKQDLVKADESALKYAEALEARGAGASGDVSGQNRWKSDSLRLWKRRMKDVRRRRTPRWRPSRPHSCGRTRPRRRLGRTRSRRPGLARQLAAAEGRADDLNKGLDALSTEHDTVTKAVVGSRLEGAEAAYEKLRLQVELKRLKKELVTAKDDAENARRELREGARAARFAGAAEERRLAASGPRTSRCTRRPRGGCATGACVFFSEAFALFLC